MFCGHTDWTALGNAGSMREEDSRTLGLTDYKRKHLYVLDHS